LRLARRLRSHGIDLTHTHNRMALIYGAPAARLAGTAVVHTKHGKNPKAGTRLLLAKLAARCVDSFVAVSPETAALARRRGEVDERRLLVITNGVDLGAFQPRAAARARVRAELKIPEDAWVAGTAGRLAVEKNQALLVRAAAPLLGPEAHLVLAGDGPLRPALAELAATRGASASVHLLGSRRDVPDVLNALDVFVLSSDTEGLPLVILEAMATGLPIVSTNVGGIADVVDEGGTGFLVPAGDEEQLRARLGSLRADPELARAFGRRARAAAEETHSSERMLSAYNDLYERVLSQRARPRRWSQ
jgi:glycosyltransferase involved in cell wall biosynthesis